MARKTSTDEHQKVEVIDFTIKLPSDINVTPWHQIEMPRDKMALVYKVEVPPDAHNHEWRRKFVVYMVHTKSGVTMKVPNQYYREPEFWDEPALKHWLIDEARRLSIKKVTRRNVEVDSVEDDDQ